LPVISVTQDPANPDKVILTSTVSLYLDKLALQALSDEIEQAVRRQAKRDLKSSLAVRKVISAAATAHLLKLLGVEPKPELETDVRPVKPKEGA
jgi:hypothetical protein